jgi:hypothetical protein
MSGWAMSVILLTFVKLSYRLNQMSKAMVRENGEDSKEGAVVYTLHPFLKNNWDKSQFII